MRNALVSATAISLLFPALTFAAGPCPYTWNSNLKSGDVSADVHALQQFLNTESGTTVAASGAGSPGFETTKFGALTKIAVVKFQEKYAAEILGPNGLIRGTGLVGPATRAKLNALCTPQQGTAVTGAVMTVVAPKNALTVTATEQPPQTLAPSWALYIPITNARLTAGDSDVVINSITVERFGPGSNAMFTDFDLFDGEGNYLDIAYLDSNGHATFRKPITVPAHSSFDISIVADMDDLTDHGGEMGGARIIAIDTAAAVSGLPIAGTLISANETLEIGTPTATRSSYDMNGTQTVYINDTARLSGIRVQANSIEDIRLNSVTWTQAGSISSSDVTAVSTVVDGVSYPAEADGNTFTSVFPNGIVIGKGYSKDMYVQATFLPSAANRTAKFDLYWGTDVDITGLGYGFGLALIPGGNTDVSGNSVFLTQDGTTDTDSLNPFYSGPLVDVSGGAFISVSR